MSNINDFWIVTDLDGTLMDEKYDISPALETLDWLKKMSIPVIPCTSKTASEVIDFRSKFNLTDPFIVENGSAVHGNDNEWELILGRSYKDLREVLAKLSNNVNYDLKPLNDLSIDQIYSLTGLSSDSIRRALDRHWSVPFLNPPESVKTSLNDFTKLYDVHIFQGNLMSHLLCKNSHKGMAILKLKNYLKQPNKKIIALGDSHNDKPLLDMADISIVVPGQNGPNQSLVSGINRGDYVLANAPHAEGWSNSINSIIRNFN